MSSADPDEWEWATEAEEAFAGLSVGDIEKFLDLGWNLNAHWEGDQAAETRYRMVATEEDPDDPEIVSLYDPENDCEGVITVFDHDSMEVRR